MSKDFLRGQKIWLGGTEYVLTAITETGDGGPRYLQITAVEVVPISEEYKRGAREALDKLWKRWNHNGGNPNLYSEARDSNLYFTLGGEFNKEIKLYE